MLIHYVLLSCLLTCVITNQAYGREFRDFDDVFPSWPSIHHVSEVALEKRQAEVALPKPGQSDTAALHVVANQAESKISETAGKAVKGVLEQVSEGNVVPNPLPPLPPLPPQPSTKQTEAPPINSNTTPKVVATTIAVSGNITQNENITVTSSTVPPASNTKVSDSTAPRAPSYQPDLGNPGVMKRGLIVFGAFALMAVAYFIFYRRKNKNNDSNNTHGNSDINQFRYGVLQSDDRRDNLELSRIPLTMESDEDEDEDLEIFDLEQKKKSLSYVNLQTSDEYVVHEPREHERDRDNLLLDIEDANSDTLINWSSNGNKSIL